MKNFAANLNRTGMWVALVCALAALLAMLAASHAVAPSVALLKHSTPQVTNVMAAKTEDDSPESVPPREDRSLAPPAPAEATGPAIATAPAVTTEPAVTETKPDTATSTKPSTKPGHATAPQEEQSGQAEPPAPADEPQGLSPSHSGEAAQAQSSTGRDGNT